MRAHTVAEREIVVCRTKQGIYALDNICTHAFARLCEGRLRGTRLICPLHGASFDVRDGRVLGAPATRALEVHAVRVVGERVEIALLALLRVEITVAGIDQRDAPAAAREQMPHGVARRAVVVDANVGHADRLVELAARDPRQRAGFFG